MGDVGFGEVSLDGGVLVQYWVENVCIFAWCQPLTAAAVDQALQRSTFRIRRYPRGISIVHVGDVRASFVDPQVREALVRATHAVQRVAAIAVVTPARGFLASTVRSVTTAVLMLSRVSTELRFDERVEDVIDWLPTVNERATGTKVEPRELLRVLQEAARRGQLQPQS
ncbi:MAG: hypothetical protein ABW321_11030 [Polyangiales bacterium]